MTIAAAPSPKIIREVRTAPILSENFSTQTSRTGRLTSWSWRTASPHPYRRVRGDRLDRIAQAAGRRILRRDRVRALYPLDERLHVAVPRVEGDHEVVVADLAGSAQLGPGAVPRVLVVQHHRPAHQR